MKLQGRIVAFFSLTLVLLVGCSFEETPTSASAPRFPAREKDGATYTIAEAFPGFLVTYTGRSVANGNTTFSYSVAGIADGSALSQLVLQIPACAGALVASSPNGGTVGPDQQSGLNGIKWGNVSVSSGQMQIYSITFAGDVPEGLIRVSAKVGSTVGSTILPGPCQGFWVSGTVFVDSDSSGTLDPDEPGIVADVTVALVDIDGNVRTDVTDANGAYAILALDGAHVLTVAASTPATDFNEELFESFAPTTATTRNLQISGDTPNVDFGFEPKAKQIATQIELGILFTNGADRSVWTKVMRAASHGASYKSLDPSEVLGLLAEIETMAFPDPYTFSDGNEINEALAILTVQSKDPAELLFRELFVTELNDAAGFGLIADPVLQDVLISWGESLIIDSQSVSKLGTGPDGIDAKPVPSIETDIQAALDVFNGLNQRGGGDIPD